MHIHNILWEICITYEKGDGDKKKHKNEHTYHIAQDSMQCTLYTNCATFHMWILNGYLYVPIINIRAVDVQGSLIFHSIGKPRDRII